MNLSTTQLGCKGQSEANDCVCCVVLYCVLCNAVFLIDRHALSPSCRLLENSAILDQYEQASMKYENVDRR
ncbi:hypothetical protein E1301_Tti000884 [Triplophysa tibetana]|uniref:Uncharacterized protein n=1 Tax=Triplophysa tibetana TaxID=1572043 RepID=A0A5A9N6Y4_9TELE|nr:hypothetical protein E1301_Tti000884 [Triplophysa tibetana]